MMDRLKTLVDRGALRSIDRHFARWVASGDPDGVKEAVMLGAALVSLNLSQGNVCADLSLHAGKLLFDETRAGDANLRAPDLESWILSLSCSSAVQVVTTPPAVSAGHAVGGTQNMASARTAHTVHGAPVLPSRPLVLDGMRLYLARYWFYECDLAERLQERARGWIEMEPKAVCRALKSVFGPLPAGETVDWQRVAAAVAAMKRLCIISGGPGTGKTHTVTAILGVLHHLMPHRPPRTALAAPTGKAAVRITESMRKALASFPKSAVWTAHIPQEAVTLHRLLGIRDGRSVPRHHEENPLHLDVLIVDEASMIDLSLMAQTLAALPPHTRLILLGDKDQLASVEAGNVFSDLCGLQPVDRDSAARFQPNRSREWAKKIRIATGMNVQEPASMGPDDDSPLGECTVFLEKSYRFKQDSEIGRLAALIRTGASLSHRFRLKSSSESFLGAGAPNPEVKFRTFTAYDLPRVLESIVQEFFLPLLQAESVEEAHERLEAFRILCALRETAFGVASINAFVEEVLARMGKIPRGTRHYQGRPVLVTQNDYDVQLFNGDVGVLWPDAAEGRLKAWFRRVDGGFRKVRVLRLPPHETAYAMTVHKAQGSEFRRVLLILPDQDAKVLTRELVYTAVTRARESVEIWARTDILEAAVQRHTERRSGLLMRLWPCSLF